MGFDFAGKDKLLGIDEICETLSISRSAFERMRKKSTPGTGLAFTDRFESVQQTSFGRGGEGDMEGMPTFPLPTLMLGKSPRWSTSDLNEWINKKA